MASSLIIELQLLSLVCLSFILPIGLLAIMFVRRAISRLSVLGFGIALLAISGADVILLQRLSNVAAGTTDRLISSELNLALYLLPALFAGIGINVISHVLIRHLNEAEDTFDRQHRTPLGPEGA